MEKSNLSELLAEGLTVNTSVEESNLVELLAEGITLAKHLRTFLAKILSEGSSVSGESISGAMLCITWFEKINTDIENSIK